jgi:hypothetical protein
MRLIFSLFTVALALVGCTGPPKATDGPQNEATAARNLYVAKCAKCHKFYDPAKYSDEEWQMWMTKMGKKSKLKPEQQEMLSRYIEDTYRSPAKTNAPPKKP